MVWITFALSFSSITFTALAFWFDSNALLNDHLLNAVRRNHLYVLFWFIFKSDKVSWLRSSTGIYLLLLACKGHGNVLLYHHMVLPRLLSYSASHLSVCVYKIFALSSHNNDQFTYLHNHFQAKAKINEICRTRNVAHRSEIIPLLMGILDSLSCFLCCCCFLFFVNVSL